MGLLYFVIGAMMGSVANAVVYRLPKNISWVKGHSMCNHCKHQLGFLDLIPVFSYLFLMGKCKYCKKSIGVRWFLLEILMGVGFVILANPLLWVIWWITLVIAYMDLETKLVSEFLVLGWGILIIISNFKWQIIPISNLMFGLFVGVVIIGGIWAISKGRAMGFGDVEIAAVMGLMLGWPNIIIAIWLAFIVGGIIGLICLIRPMGQIKNLKSEIAFGPFLIIGTWVAYFAGDMISKYVFLF